LPDTSEPKAPDSPAILSVGHSNLAYDAFLALLRGAGVTAVADVRSVPRSKAFPHFDAPALKRRLAADGVAYVWMGRELGGRPSDQHLYREGVADYATMAGLPSFRRGLERLRDGAARYRVAMMCSEAEPTECHRCLLVGRALHDDGMTVCHVMRDGRTVSQAAVEAYLLALSGQLGEDLFRTRDERVDAAYRVRARRVAHASGD